jgi:hypothetical protein
MISADHRGSQLRRAAAQPTEILAEELVALIQARARCSQRQLPQLSLRDLLLLVESVLRGSSKLRYSLSPSPRKG